MKTYKDIYEFPLVADEYMKSRIHDSKGNFVFQFEFNPEGYDLKELQEKIVKIINGEENQKSSSDLTFKHVNGHIIDNLGNKLILIRGWGNLTGIGAHNLPEEEAANIQDTFAEYIVERLNYREP